MSDDRLEQLRRIAELEPDDVVAQYGLGRALLRAGRFQEAARALSRALALDPEYSAAHRDLGRAELEGGDAERAIETLRRGIAVARRRGDLQTVREMEVFLRRAERAVERERSEKKRDP